MTGKQLPGLSKYRITDCGQVVSFWKQKPAVLRGGHDKDGYRKFVLIDDMGSRRYVRRASLVCAAYHGPRPKGKEVRHKDGSRTNDSASNLEWATHRENCADKIKHGTVQRGERGGNVKISEKQAREIKRRLKGAESPAKIARDVGCSKFIVHNIKYGKSWAWLDLDTAA